MADQETLWNGDPKWKPEAHGLWARFIDGDPDSYQIDQGTINKARSQGEVVGSCRACGEDLVVMATQDPMVSGSSVAWTDFICTGCDKQTAAPNLRRLHRNSQHMRMPQGWWQARFTALKSATSLRSS